MSTLRVVLHSLWYYWRTNLAVLLGVVAGTAVIGGALVVGDSVRFSLRKMTYDRLGDIDHVLTGPRFFREELAGELARDDRFRKQFDAAAPALVLTGGLEYKTRPQEHSPTGDVSPPLLPARPLPKPQERSRRMANVAIYGIDQAFWELTDHGSAAFPGDDEVVLNRRVAEELHVQPGQRVMLSIELPAAVPRDSLLGKRDQTTLSIPLLVKAILGEELRLSRLSLNPNQQLPPNAFVALHFLQRKLGLQATPARRKSRIVGTGRSRRRVMVLSPSKPARVNTIFFHARNRDDGEKTQAPQAASRLTDLLQGHLRLEDLSLRIVRHESRGAQRAYLSLESAQQILADEFARAGRSAAAQLKLTASPVLVYLANEMVGKGTEDVLYGVGAAAGAGPAKALLQKRHSGGKVRGWFSRYSIVAGLNVEDLRSVPFGPLEFVGERPTLPLGKRDILLNDWLADDLQVRVGDEIRLRYHVVGSHIVDAAGRLPEVEVAFTVKGIVKLEGTVADDAGFTPEVEGITDADSFDDWDKPFDMKDVTPRDEAYWKRYRATPKAFLALQTAQELWGSLYGRLTSVRVSLPAGKSLDESEKQFAAAVLRQLTPKQTHLVVRAVKYDGLQAASGTTDFSGLFLAFSFFLILSATILIGLLFRLSVERRGESVGLLQAVGFSPRGVRWLFLLEGLTVVILGGLAGIAAAWGYASLMIYGLKHWWYGAIRTQFLFVHLRGVSLLGGFASAVLVAMGAVWWALRYFRRFSSRELLAGEREPASRRGKRRGRASRWMAIGSTTLAAVLLTAALTGLLPAEQEAFEGFSWQVVAFFVVGIALLIAGLQFLSWWLAAENAHAVAGHGWTGLARLGLRNASRHRQRSVMTVALMASATFVIVAVAAGHRNPAEERPRKTSGNGGFTLLARSSAPLLHDLNTPAGRKQLELDATREIIAANNRADAARKNALKTDPAEAARLIRLAEQNHALILQLQRRMNLLEKMTVVSFRVQPGEDASCLNIYQTRLPTILGVPPQMIARGGFKFVGAKEENPWTLLEERLDPEDHLPVYPVLGDMNTLQYSLHKGVGETIPVPSRQDARYKLKIVGMFDGSVFQGALLMSEENFRRLYPQRVGYEYFLIDVPYQTAAQWRADTEGLRTALETGLDRYGFDTQLVAERIAEFLAVQNTYLSTFQSLGGLGLLLGTLGLATVMLRNVLERRSELALLQAVGFRKAGLSWLVLVENALLLVWGLLTGTLSALLAMGPHLVSIGADVPWLFLAVMLLSVLVIGMASATAAVREAVRTPLLATLRSE